MVFMMGPNKRRVTYEYIVGVFKFAQLCCAQEKFKKEIKLRCPCKVCKCKKGHHFLKGFMEGYYY